MQNLNGSIVAVITPFQADESIDFQAFEDLVRFHLDNGTNGVVVAGTTGEGYALEAEELRDLVTCAVNLVKKRIPVIAGTGTLVTKKTIHLSKTAQEAGADGLLIINPYYNKPSDEFLLQHFAAVDAAVNIPIIVYNVPGRTGYNMTPSLIVELAHTCKNITAVKEASGNLDQIVEIIQKAPKGFKVYSGDDALAYSTIALGGHGVISVAANIIPAVMANMCSMALAGDLDSSKEIHHQYLDLFNANFIDTNPVPVKTAMYRMGYCQNNFRAPFYPWKNKQKMDTYFSILEKSGVELEQLVLR
ncbi:MAG TPA: 4-hydroxy-tetrahydrodipicolinate synthase [Flavobacteriales bacterium]|nr:4-hydroxy-tetrahydrodipicolinate synthase [Flavobacteriales bacterium]